MQNQRYQETDAVPIYIFMVAGIIYQRKKYELNTNFDDNRMFLFKIDL